MAKEYRRLEVKFRVEFGWGDENQALVAFVHAADESAARRVAMGMLTEITVVNIQPVQAKAMFPSAPARHTLEQPTESEDDHSRWMRPS